MTAANDYPPLEIGPRSVPVPGTVSDAARQYLSRPTPMLTDLDLALDDKEGWRAHIAGVNAAMLEMEKAITADFAIDVERTTINGARAAIVRPRNPDPRFAGRVLMNIHGGAFIYGEGMITEAATYANAGATVVAVDYRTCPDHPFPANLEDSAAVYRGLLDDYDPGRIAIYGTSAGATFTLTTSLYLRQLGLPLPAALGVLSPRHDLAELTGDSLFAFDGIDPVVSAGMQLALLAADLFIDGHDATDPLISPIFGDYAGFPPTYFLSGTRDSLLSPTILLHRHLHRAGVKTELHVFEAMPHGFNAQAHLPEAQETVSDLLRFFDEHLAR